jgi:tetratricopeptide (TPR) repeat protein
MSTVRKVLSVCEAGAPLSEWLDGARRGGRALLILGEQGAGRSTILRELHRLAVAQGVVVAETWCRGDAAEPPHLPLMHLLESLAYDAGEPAAPLRDALDKWSQNPQAWHLASRLIYPLRELARRQPILLLIDDLHHAHENLQRIIVNWLIALRMEPIGLAMTAATPHKSQLLRELEQVIGERAAGEVWSLRMLTREETAQRVRALLSNPPDADALANTLHDLTGGNPLFLSEILTSLQADTTHTPASLASLIPQSLREGVLRRFEGLPKPAQDIGRALSLMDDALYPDAAQAMQPDQQLERLNEAIRLYAGDLLPEFADESWCSVAHQRMRVLLVECLLARAQRYYVRGEYADAAADCERILQVDPTDEGALCLLLQIYAAQGHRTEAARLFHHTQQHARERFGHALAPTTVETFQRLFG